MAKLKLSPLPKDAPEFGDKTTVAEVMTRAGYPMNYRSIESWSEVVPAFWAGTRAVYRLREVHAAAEARLSPVNPRADSLTLARATKSRAA